MITNSKYFQPDTILTMLKSNESFIAGMHELFSFCNVATIEDVEANQPFLMNCLNIIKSHIYLRSGNAQLDYFMVILKNSYPLLFNQSCPSFKFIYSLMQILGYNIINFQQPRNNQQLPPPPIPIQPTNNIPSNMINLNMSQINSSSIPSNQNLSEPNNISMANPIYSQMIHNQSSNTNQQVSTPHASIPINHNVNGINFQRIQDMIYLQQHQQQQPRNSNSQPTTGDGHIISNEVDLNSYNIQMMPQNMANMQNINQANGVNIPMNMINFQNFNNVAMLRQPQLIPMIQQPVDENMVFNNMNQRLPNHINSLNVNAVRNSLQNNIVYIPNNNINRTPNNIFNQPQLMPNNMGNTVIYQHQPAMMQPSFQPMATAIRRQMSPHPLLTMGAIRPNNGINIANSLIRQPPMVMMPNINNNIQPQMLPQFVNQNINIDQTNEMINMNQFGNLNWPNSSNMHPQPMMQPTLIRDNNNANMVVSSGVPMQLMLNAGNFPCNFIPNNNILRTPNFIHSTPTLERSASQPRAISNQSQTISRPISDISKPSTIHYHPTTQDQSEISKTMMNNIPDIKACTPVSNVTEIDTNMNKHDKDYVATQGSGGVLASHSNYNTSSNMSDNPLSPSRLNTSNFIQPLNPNIELNVPTCYISLCSKLPSNDAVASRAVLEEALASLKTDNLIIVSIPCSTFLDVTALRKNEAYIFEYHQPFVIKENIFDTITSKDHLDVQLRCTCDGCSINVWPKDMILKINDHLLNVERDEIYGDASLLIKDKMKRTDNILEVTGTILPEGKDYTRCISSNTSTNSSNNGMKGYKFTLNLILRANCAAMLKSLVNKRTLSVIKSIENIQNHFVKNPMDMARGYMVLSFMCPFGNRRIKIPVRNETCKHIQCLDYESICQLNYSRAFFLCPVCDVEMSVQTLVIDGFMCSLITQMKDISNVNEVHITPECNWSVYSPEENPAELSKATNTSIRSGVATINKANPSYKDNNIDMGVLDFQNADIFALFGKDSNPNLNTGNTGNTSNTSITNTTGTSSTSNAVVTSQETINTLKTAKLPQVSVITTAPTPSITPTVSINKSLANTLEQTPLQTATNNSKKRNFSATGMNDELRDLSSDHDMFICASFGDPKKYCSPSTSFDNILSKNSPQTDDFSYLNNICHQESYVSNDALASLNLANDTSLFLKASFSEQNDDILLSSESVNLKLSSTNNHVQNTLPTVLNSLWDPMDDFFATDESQNNLYPFQKNLNNSNSNNINPEKT